MKFVHAADIHLDSPLRGLERYEGAPAQELRGATRRALENLVALCIEEEAGLLVIAGDLYDGEWLDYNTGLFFVKQMARLTRAGVRVVWVRGNHDAASRITRSLSLPPGAIELASRAAQTLEIEDLGVAVHGQSYGRQDVREDLAARYPEPRRGWFNLGVLHTALDGREGHDAYAPCTVDRLMSHGYDYWALGHVHRREVVCEDPWIVFPGNLQGRHARETGPKGATVVTVEDGRVLSLEPRALDVVRWVDLGVDVSEAASAQEAVDRVRRALEAECEVAGDRLLAARVRLHGRSHADSALRAERERWRHEIEAAALGLGAAVWIEKIGIETEPDADLDAILKGDGPVASLVRAIRGLGGDPEAQAEILRRLVPLRDKLPREYRDRPDAIDFDDPGALAGLLAEVERDLLPRLLEIGEST